MSRNLWIVLLVMCAGIAALIVMPKFKPSPGPTTVEGTEPAAGHAGTSSHAGTPGTTVTPPTPGAGTPPGQTAVVTPGNTGTPSTQPGATVVAPSPGVAPLTTGTVLRPGGIQPMTNDLVEAPDTKPLPVLEKEYLATTNRDDRLDLMMDITDWPGPEAVRTLTRLFQAEQDAELKVDLLDSLLGIEGQVEEKLQLLSLGTQKGLPTEVRQSAIDGLIDLEDQRVIPILNGLLNDPEEEIRESAQDALEMLQAQPSVKSK